MTSQQVSEAVLTLQALSKHAQQLRQDREDAIEMVAALDAATLYLLGYLDHLRIGLDPYDALRAAARGDLPPSGVE